jgi:cold shock CspA family protein
MITIGAAMWFKRQSGFGFIELGEGTNYVFAQTRQLKHLINGLAD